MSKQKKIHFNLIDVLIILAFVLLIAGFTFYATGHWQTNSKTTQETDCTVKYTLLLENISPEVALSIKEGDVLKEQTDDTVKGTIVKINKREKYLNKEAFNAETGKYTTSEHPRNYTVEIVVESSCVLNNETAMIDKTEIKVGKQCHYKTVDYAFAAYITDVEKIDTKGE